MSGLNPACLDDVWLAWNDHFMAGKKNDIENQPLELALIRLNDLPVDTDILALTAIKKEAGSGHLHDSGSNMMSLLTGTT